MAGMETCPTDRTHVQFNIAKIVSSWKRLIFILTFILLYYDVFTIG
jgi:hypothetical protein